MDIFAHNATELKISDKDFDRLCRYMYDNYGIALEKKRTLVEGRLSNTLKQAGYTGFTDYIDDIIKDKSGEKITQLISKLTTNYTYFMREDAHYRFLTNVALPHWTSKVRDGDLRIWSAGCSSGEEAYTTAMVLNEYFGAKKSAWDTKVLATDISSRVLNEAKAGLYPVDRLERLPDAWKKKYFVPGPTHDKVKIAPVIADEVVFGHFNLMGDFNRFRKKFHVIFCRNVMIYFDNPTKEALVNRFYNVLEPGGFLFIGLSETISGMNTKFTQVASAIYKK